MKKPHYSIPSVSLTSETQAHKELWGLKQDSLTIIASPPEMGKTTFATSLALDTLQYDNTRIVFFTCGKNKQRIILQRMLAALTNIELDRIIQRYTSEGEKKKLVDSLQQTLKYDFFVDDSTASLKSIERKCLKHQESLSLIIVDDIHLLKTGKETQETNMQGLRRIAREFEASVVAFTPVNEDYDPDTGEPALADIDEAYTEFADLVMLPRCAGF